MSDHTYIDEAWASRLRYFPLRKKGKTPAVRTWSYATAQERPTGWVHNWGIPTGRESGIFVLDVDPRHGGNDSLRELTKKHGLLPDTFTVDTPSGGTHYYWKYCAQGDARIKCSAGELGPGLDIRGDGGYVVAPGSFSGENDKLWQQRYGPGREQPADAPAWLQMLVLGLSPNGKKKPRKLAPSNSKIPNGQRNDALTRQAGHLLNSGFTTEGSLYTALTSWASENLEDPNIDDRKTRDIVSRAINGWEISQQPSTAVFRPQHEYNALELAERFAETAKDNILYATDDQSWFDYVDSLYTENKGGASRQISQYLKSQLPTEPDKEEDPKLHSFWKWVKDKLYSKRLTTDVEFFAKTQPALGIHRENFDHDEMVIGLPDGKALDLRNGEVRDATPADRLTQRLNVMPAQTADESTCPHWLKYLLSAHPDEDTRKFLQMFFGYCLTASDIEQCIVFFIGAAGSGKQTMLEPITAILGHYYKELGLSALLAKTNDDRRNNYLAQLVGVRLATIGEMPFAEILDTNILKHLSGSNNKICARRLGHQPFEFTPQYKILICSNSAPNLSMVDEAIRQRIRVVPFNVRFRGTDKQDKYLPEKLQKESPGILRWMIDGCLMWQRTPGGLFAPKAIQEGTEAYLKVADVFENFLQETFVIDPNGSAQTAIAFAKWREYAIRNGYIIGDEKGFKERLTAKLPQLKYGVFKFNGQYARGYKGMRLPHKQDEVFRYEAGQQMSLGEQTL